MAALEKALVLAAHGSRYPGAMAALGIFRDRVAAAHPRWRVELARTAGRRHGSAAAYGGTGRVPDVLAALVGQGVRRLVVQSLHVVPGEEYHEMLLGLRRYLEDGGERLTVSVGAPLLADAADVDRVADIVLQSLADRRGPLEGLVLMGHGAPPPGAGFYAALGASLARADRLAHFGTMPRGPSSPDIARIREALLAAEVRSAWLLPFFTVAGAHAWTDLAGDGATSWQGVLAAAGITCRPVLAGLIESEAYCAVWRDHLEKAMARLG